MSESVESADGTHISFERQGEGPPLILVEPILHYREFSAFTGLVPLLATEFTVCTYDRRGRGESGDTLPYSPDREVDDLEVLIRHVGQKASIYGFSSGAQLALHAAARGLPITRLALLEPPMQDDDTGAPDPLTRTLSDLIGQGRGGDAIEHFHQSIGVPDEYVVGMRSTPTWPKMEAVAHTMVYDCTISDVTTTSVLQDVTYGKLMVMGTLPFMLFEALI